MINSQIDNVSVNILNDMKKNGFDFSHLHSIDFYILFLLEHDAQKVSQNFNSELINTEIIFRKDNYWELKVSRVMFVLYSEIKKFELYLKQLITHLNGVFDGWGVIQELNKKDFL